MPCYFFDIHDGGFSPDNEGTNCSGVEAARAQALATLPEFSRWVIPKHGDNQSFTVLVRNEGGHVVYMATLTFAGLRLA